MKKILLMVCCLSQLAFAYKAKSEDLGKYSIEGYKPQIQEAIKKAGIAFDGLGDVYEAPNLGYYNFATIEKDGKVVAYTGLTHVKSYNKHEALITVISPEGKLLGFYLPDANDKHQNVHDQEWINKYLGKVAEDLPVDSLAGSTFHAYSVNGELRNTLKAFDYKKADFKK
ncbi:hypothetical protein [Cetobacterium sp.]|uniref:hypothetical protein n=1 Tax=Cetobacterium sp. TaxID=2071632 RepID=UPI0025F5AFA1|nr:hypothetical protein [uncultured Cetobacterium sp.]